MDQDAELLRCYTEDRSEEAFAQLVARHLPLVYSAALRQIGGDAHLAQDVAQIVFATFARKAGTLQNHPALVAWLYRTTHYAAAKIRRGEQRRQLREQSVLSMHDSLNELSAPADWGRLRPAIDAAMLQLAERDRTAVLLRFFENRPFAEIGLQLGLSENNARMRVERALGILHGALAKRGITSTTAALGLALSTQAISAAPAGLATSIAAGALTAGVGSGTMLFMSTTILKTGLLAVIFAAGSTGLILQHRSITELGALIESLRSEAKNSAWLQSENRRLANELAGRDDEHTELLRLQSEVADLNQRLNDAASAKAGDRTGSWSTAPTAKTPILTMQNQGNATPASAVETMYWAIHNLDANAFARILDLGPARAEVQAAFDDLPENVRQELGTPEKIIAESLLADSANLKQITAMQVLNLGMESGNEAPIRVNIQDVTGKIREDMFVLHHTDAGWQVPFSGSIVRQYLHNYLKSHQ